MRFLSLTSVMLLLAGVATRVVAAPVIGVPTAGAASVGCYQKFELRVPVTGTVYTNPYYYAATGGGALLRATFTAPSGAVKTIDGFYADGYTLTSTTTGALAADAAANGWRVRFAPTEVGQWRYSLTFQDGGGISPAVTGAFSVTASTDPGFVRRLAGKNYFRFDNNTAYIPVGENLAWYNGNGVGDLKTWLDKLAANRANCIRLWLCAWGIELEWKNGAWGGYQGLKKYQQARSFELDWVMDYCATKGIYVELCLNNHGQFVAAGANTQWADNPYNSANGGPCTSTAAFFSNSTAKTTFKNKLRYLVARYGYAKNLMAWELCNEQDLIDNYNAIKATVATWDGEMANYLKSIDVNKHLISNSYAFSTGDPTVWNHASIDFLQNHIYQKRADLERPLAETAVSLTTTHNKPYLTGEFGLETDNGLTMPDDPNGIHFRNTMWSSAFNGSAGPGLTWWWDEYIHPLNTKSYPVMLRLRNFLDANVNPVANNYQPVSPELTTTTGQTLTIVPGFQGFQPPTYAATAAPANSFTVNANGTLSPSEASLSNTLFGNWHAAAKNPPTFQVNYPVAGQFQVKVSGIGASATLVIKRNGVVALTQVNPVAGATYSISMPAGAGTITLDNTGNDWIQLTSVAFTNYQPRLTGSALRDGQRVVGYIRNRDYTWDYFLNHNQTAPATVAGGRLIVRNLTAGVSYTLTTTNCAAGTTIANTAAVAAADGTVSVALPTVAWDVAFVLKPTGAARPLGTSEDTPLATSAAPLPAPELWPNPAQGSTTVSLPDITPGPVSYELFDALGRSQWRTTDAEPTPMGRQQLIPLSQVPQGTYILRVSTPTGQRTTRLVVSN